MVPPFAVSLAFHSAKVEPPARRAIPAAPAMTALVLFFMVVPFWWMSLRSCGAREKRSRRISRCLQHSVRDHGTTALVAVQVTDATGGQRGDDDRGARSEPGQVMTVEPDVGTVDPALVRVSDQSSFTVMFFSGAEPVLVTT